jgi:hypothetical protein
MARKKQPVQLPYEEKIKDDMVIPEDINTAETILGDVFQKCSDFRLKRFKHFKSNTEYLLAWIDGMSDKEAMREHVVEGILNVEKNMFTNSNLTDGIIPIIDINREKNFKKTIDELLSGSPILILDGAGEAIIMALSAIEARDVTESNNENNVRGPKEAFTESLRTNGSLIRKKIHTPNLKLEEKTIGEITKTKLLIAYIEGIAKPEIIEEVRKRISQIKIDSVLESAYIEEFIEDNKFTVFPQIEHTEKPDKVAAALLEGRITIIVDGTPTVIIVPTVFACFLQTAEDYYERYIYTSFVRILRFAYINISLLFPSIYIATTTFHPEMIPTKLLLTIVASREGIPFPAFIEALLMEVTFEVLREAGVRLPRAIGQTISIVGALVIGQAAVQAGIVSPAMVIVVSTTAIASFSIPAYNIAFALRFLKFPMMILAASFGFYGIIYALLLILIHLCRLKSFGVPYLSGFAPFIAEETKDTFFRGPWWWMYNRPRTFQPQKRKRQSIKEILHNTYQKWLGE